ncbi:uncharacterized protein KQ657_004092 [Scheffersomyces spartinae]|uniref:Uncharacterized protein n=1 Tax=Scheffersomyces spartinae TaxID=45513 RepID=A0A9P7VBF4_9ASCO|nr:uncharacterized protein KQ657_004092 [Scheffersomyces spartinae]KAG7194981.1 hypothetical protein KQ657_004092 [Scheffersomyces spartinae]
MDHPQTPKPRKRVLLNHYRVPTLPSPEKLSPSNSTDQRQHPFTDCYLTPKQSQSTLAATPESPIRKRPSIDIITPTSINEEASSTSSSSSSSSRPVTPQQQLTSTPSESTPVQRWYHPMTTITVEELQKVKRVRLSNPFLEDPFQALPAAPTTIDNETRSHMEYVNGTTGKKSTVKLSQRQVHIKPKRLDFSNLYGF